MPLIVKRDDDETPQERPTKREVSVKQRVVYDVFEITLCGGATDFVWLAECRDQEAAERLAKMLRKP